jgi:endonuclease-3
MKSEDEVMALMERLDEIYPVDGICFLTHSKPWELLFATILSAQCTDARVNMVTPALFAKYPTLEAFAAAAVEELEEMVKPTGFFRTKAKHLKAAAALLLANYGGELPEDMDKLTQLPGVGRKTANLIRGHIFGIPSIIVDTHVKRISKRLGLSQSEDPYKAELELSAVLPAEHWTRYNTQIIEHGRAVCLSRNPRCRICALAEMCGSRKSEISVPLEERAVQ